MAVPVEWRDGKKNSASVLVWTVSQLFGLAFLYSICYHDVVYNQMFGETSSANQQVRTALFSMIAIRTLSQLFWAVFILAMYFPLGGAFGITLFNVVNDSIVALVTLRNRSEISDWDYLIFAVFILGIGLERFSEVQRTLWKAQLENKGKMHVNGLFGVAVHINYTGYLMWRAALLGFTHVLPMQLIVLFFVNDFVRGDIAQQRIRNIKKYGDDFKRYWDSTPKLLPAVY